MALHNEPTHEDRPNTTTAPREAVVAGEPGYGLGLAGFIVSFFVGLAGLIMSAIALKQSKAIGKRNGFALAGLIIGIVKTAVEVLAIVGIIIAVVSAGAYCNAHPAECRAEFQRGYDNGSGRYYNDSMQAPDQTY